MKIGSDVKDITLHPMIKLHQSWKKKSHPSLLAAGPATDLSKSH